MAPPICTLEEKAEDKGLASDCDASSEGQSSDSFYEDILNGVEVAAAESGAPAGVALVQEILPVSASAEMNPPEETLMELDTNLPSSLSGARPRHGFNRNQEARSLFQYFSSSRNADDQGPLKVGATMGVDEELSIRRRSVPLANVPAVPISIVDPNVPIRRINRRARRLEVPLTIREAVPSPRVAALALPLGKNKEKAPELQMKAKKARKLCSTSGGGEGSGSTPNCSQAKVSTQSDSTRMIDEDGTEFVNCSDEETMFVLSADDDYQQEVTIRLPNPILRRRQYEASRRFQETWAARLLWAEMTHSEDGLIQGVKCLICSAVEKRAKFLKVKYDTLTKHAGRRKALKDIVGVAKKGEWYYSKNCAHAKNAVLYAQRGPQTVHQLVQNESGERARKRVQFGTMFHVLKEGRPMTDYESLNRLLNFLKVDHLPKKHWTDSSGWQIAVMHAQVNQSMREVLANSKYLAVTCDEVTSIDNASWICIHVYTEQNWTREPMLLSLQYVQDASARNLTDVIADALRVRGGLSREEIASRLISFGADGASVFQGVRTGVTQQLTKNHAPFLTGIHCMSHRVDLALKTLSNLPVVSNVEDLLQVTYGYFSHSSKRHHEFTKLAALMEKKGNKILKQVKTRWISLLKPAKRILQQYSVLVYKMHLDTRTVKAAEKAFEALVDVETMLGLACLVPLLEQLNDVIKFSQRRNIFVCDFVAAVKHCQKELFLNYCDGQSAYQSDVFYDFNALADFSHPDLKMASKPDLNIMEEHLVFECNTVPVWAKHKVGNPITYEFVTRSTWSEVVAGVKQACRAAAEDLSMELATRFPANQLMDAMGIFYPQYWMQPSAVYNRSFEVHLEVIKQHLSNGDRLISVGTVDQLSVEPIISWARLNYEAGTFKLAMIANAEAAMLRPLEVNPFTSIWKTITSNGMLSFTLSEFIKVAEIACVQVLGSTEDERTFSTLTFIKNRLRNRLTTHLELVVAMFAQKFYTIDNFPYPAVYAAWQSGRHRRGV